MTDDHSTLKDALNSPEFIDRAAIAMALEFGSFLYSPVSEWRIAAVGVRDRMLQHLLDPYEDAPGVIHEVEGGWQWVFRERDGSKLISPTFATMGAAITSFRERNPGRIYEVQSA